MAGQLQRAGVSAAALHGGLAQGARDGSLEEFRRGEVRALVATDLASRGIDLPGLCAVVSFDLPRSTATYVHRSGRVGRAGARGAAVSLVGTSRAEAAHLRLIERRYPALTLRHQAAKGFHDDHQQQKLREQHENKHNQLGRYRGENSDSSRGPADPEGGGIKGYRKSKKDKLREQRARECE